MEIIKRYFKSPEGSYFLFGPRGTGKTTWLKTNCKNELIIDLLDPALYRRYIARPERLKELIEGNPDKKNLIIDEIQKVPALLDVVHLIMEEKPQIRFILTGSNARKIKQKGVDLLAGRAVLRSLHPFMAAELENGFDLQKALNEGLIPLVFYAKNPADTLNSYINLYMKEEIQAEGLIRDIGSFARFLETISFSHATVLNLNNVARECEVKRETVGGYIEILYDLLIAYSLPVFAKRAKRAVIKHPKFYFFDAVVFRIIRPAGPLDRPGEIDGPCLEGLIAQHIRAWIDYSNSSYKFYYWRTQAGAEVDFVIYGEDGFWAIEVKNTKNVNRSQLRHLKTFCNDYPECKPAFIYRGNEKLLIDNILCIPCDEFLRNIEPGKSLL
jgi:uncharacterized protein